MTDTPDAPIERKSWMTPQEVSDARTRLGELWHKGRPLFASELARALRLAGRDPGINVISWQRGKTTVTGPVSALITLYLKGVKPPDGIPEGGPVTGEEHHWSGKNRKK
jgi:hypothetical protein